MHRSSYGVGYRAALPAACYSQAVFCADPFELYSVVTGSLRLDGGAMFGVVPKVLWEKLCDVDDQNRILLATRTLLAVHGAERRVVLVDTGCGTKWISEHAARFAITFDPEAVPRALAAIGLSVPNVTDVVITHLHFDHNGGLTEWYDDPGGRTVLRFPGARHWIHRDHWDHANAPHVKDRGSFLPQDFAELAGSGLLTFVEGARPDPPFPGMAWWVSHGHTPAQLHPVFGAGKGRILFVGDIVPTVAHLRPGWVMAYDVAPVTTIDEKQAWYRRCFDEGIGLVFPHDPKVPGVILDGTVERPVVARALPL